MRCVSVRRVCLRVELPVRKAVAYELKAPVVPITEGTLRLNQLPEPRGEQDDDGRRCRDMRVLSALAREIHKAA